MWFPSAGFLAPSRTTLRWTLGKSDKFSPCPNANGLEQTQGAHGIHIGRVFGGLKADCHVALGTQDVDLFGLDLLQYAHQVGRVRQIAVVQREVAFVDVWVLVNVVYPLRVERRGSALDAVHLVAFFEQKLCKVRTVFARDAGDECFFHCLMIFTD